MFHTQGRKEDYLCASTKYSKLDYQELILAVEERKKTISPLPINQLPYLERVSESVLFLFSFSPKNRRLGEMRELEKREEIRVLLLTLVCRICLP